MKKVLLVLWYIFLFLVLLYEFFWALVYNASWLILLSIVILIILGIFRLNKILSLKKFNVALIIILIMIPSIIAIGSNDRAGTKRERQYIFNYLEKKYESSNFELINLRFKNEKSTAILSVNTFKWNNFEATYEDKNGYNFKVYGYNEGFNNIISIRDNYFVIKTVNEYNYQYDNNIYDIKAGYSESGYYLNYHVNYEEINKNNFNSEEELIYINNIRTKILSYNFVDEIEIEVTYEYKNGNVKYVFNKFIIN